MQLIKRDFINNFICSKIQRVVMKLQLVALSVGLSVADAKASRQ